MAEQKRPRRTLDSDSDEDGANPGRNHDSDGDDEDEEQDDGASAPVPATRSEAAAVFMQRSQAAQQRAEARQQQSGSRNRSGSSRSRRSDAQEDSEDSGEDIMENLENDYRAIPELDRYDEELLDDAEQDELDIEERQRVERLLAERDEKEGRARMRTRVPLALDSSSDDDEADVLEQQRRLRIQESAALGGRIAAPADGQEAEPLDLDTFANTPLSEWIHLGGPRDEIMRQFSVFLNTFTDDNGYGDPGDDEEDDNERLEAPFYREKIIQMCVRACVRACIWLSLRIKLSDTWWFVNVCNWAVLW